MNSSDFTEKSALLPCTACGECRSYCPVSINIPAYLSVYNDYLKTGSLDENAFSKIDSAGKPSDCIGCGSCRATCPSSINTPYYMEVLDKLTKDNQNNA